MAKALGQIKKTTARALLRHVSHIATMAKALGQIKKTTARALLAHIGHVATMANALGQVKGTTIHNHRQARMPETPNIRRSDQTTVQEDQCAGECNGVLEPSTNSATRRRRRRFGNEDEGVVWLTMAGTWQHTQRDLRLVDRTTKSRVGVGRGKGRMAERKETRVQSRD
jgi:hypothetical protein